MGCYLDPCYDHTQAQLTGAHSDLLSQVNDISFYGLEWHLDFS